MICPRCGKPFLLSQVEMTTERADDGDVFVVTATQRVSCGCPVVDA